MEVISCDRKPEQVARDYDVHPNTVRNWIKKFKENGVEVFNKNGEVKELEEKVAKFERLLGEKEREIAIDISYEEMILYQDQDSVFTGNEWIDEMKC